MTWETTRPDPLPRKGPDESIKSRDSFSGSSTHARHHILILALLHAVISSSRHLLQSAADEMTYDPISCEFAHTCPTYAYKPLI